jgi:hypothetical protein
MKQFLLNSSLVVAMIGSAFFVSSFAIDVVGKDNTPPAQPKSYEVTQAIMALEDMRDWVDEDLMYVQEDSVLYTRLQAYRNNLDFAIEHLNK